MYLIFSILKSRTRFKWQFCFNLLGLCIWKTEIWYLKITIIFRITQHSFSVYTCSCQWYNSPRHSTTNLLAHVHWHCLYQIWSILCCSKEVFVFCLKTFCYCFSDLPKRGDLNQSCSLTVWLWLEIRSFTEALFPLWGGVWQMAELLLTRSSFSPRQLSWSVHFRSRRQFGIFSGLLGVNVLILRRYRRFATSASSTRPRWRL